MQLPDDENGQQANREVSERGNGAVQVHDSQEQIRVETLSVHRKPVPEVVDWGTFEDGEEEEDQAPDHAQRHHGVENPRMHLGHGDAQQGDSDRQFCNDACYHVEYLANPPALHVAVESVQLSGLGFEDSSPHTSNAFLISPG